MNPTKQDLIDGLERLDLDWGDEDDAKSLVEVILERYSPLDAWTWMAWIHPDLGVSPLEALRSGRSREVFMLARGMVAT